MSNNCVSGSETSNKEGETVGEMTDFEEKMGAIILSMQASPWGRKDAHKAILAAFEAAVAEIIGEDDELPPYPQSTVGADFRNQLRHQQRSRAKLPEEKS